MSRKPVKETCYTCGGDGREEFTKSCSKCGGDGHVTGLLGGEKACSKCDGYGWEAWTKDCTECGGKGYTIVMEDNFDDIHDRDGFDHNDY